MVPDKYFIRPKVV